MKKALKILIIFALSCVFALSTGTLTFFLLTSDVVLDESKILSKSQSIEIFDEFGNRIEEISSDTGNRNVSLKELKSDTIDAFLAIEDKGFYSHKGINPKRMLKATYQNFKSGSFSEGASTITQQLIKNTHLTSEKTIRRKLKEIRLALKLEQRFEKDQILECYLNTIYFGHKAFGIKNASRYYFDKEPSNLSLSESAVLAGLLQSPNRYSPINHPEICEKRRNLVLKEMKRDGRIGEIEYEEALKEEIKTVGKDEKKNSYLSIVFEELEALGEEKGFDLFSIRVKTHYDPEKQKILEESGCKVGEITSKDGKIEAYYTEVGSIRRLPGSIIKPLAVYAPCLEEELISPATPILDEKIDFNGYQPSNYNDRYEGFISVREAVSKSSNIPAVKLLNELGIKKSLGYLEKMGLKSEENTSLTLALGGMKYGYNLKELIDAYSVFQNEGAYRPFRAINRVETEDGAILCQTEQTSKRVFRKETTTLMNDMLRSVVTEGTGKKLKRLPYPVYAKTGTVGTNQGNTDAYTIAFTGENLVGIWLGNADYSVISESGGGKTAEITAEVFEKMYQDRTPKDVAKSERIQRIMLDRVAYEKEHRLLLADPASPPNERIYEVFAPSQIPLKTADSFSHPSIRIPSISVVDGHVLIKLCETKYYSYDVEREGNGDYTMIYKDIQSSQIEDYDVSEGKTYRYFITPHYLSHYGKKIPLPLVTIPLKEPEILKKDWWNE